MTFTSNQPMVEGVNYYWISIEMKPEASLLTTFTVQMPMAEINNMPATIVWDGKSDVRRMGIGVATPVTTGLRPTVFRGW